MGARPRRNGRLPDLAYDEPGHGPRRARRYRRVPWALAGGVWVADDADSTLIRLDPVGLHVSARLPAGDGPSGLAFDGTYLWLVSHRENSLDRIDPATDVVTRVATALSPPETTAAERVAELGGSLWITGRGSTCSAARRRGRRSEPSRSGLPRWTSSPTARASGRPPSRRPPPPRRPGDGRAAARGRGRQVVARVAATRRLFVNGLAAEDGALWVYDGVAGLLVRLPT